MDASVLVSAVTSLENIPRRAVNLAMERDEVALSSEVWAEISEVMMRTRLARFILPELRDEVLASLSTDATWFNPGERVSDCRDAKDNKYLELALASGAEIVLSGDGDLLCLDPWRGIRILRPRDYLVLRPE